MASEAQIFASMKYDAANTKRISLKLDKKTDKDILNKLSSVDNMQGYIKGLIRRDIHRTKEKPLK